jgi:hypothetical protein
MSNVQAFVLDDSVQVKHTEIIGTVIGLFTDKNGTRYLVRHVSTENKFVFTYFYVNDIELR